MAPAGYVHFKRCFDAYNLVYVKSGAFYLAESDTGYEIKEGELLVLEPGNPHWGHLPCRETTEIYWIHLSHSKARRTLEYEEIPWSVLLPKNGDNDDRPNNQYMYLPKLSSIDPTTLVPILDRMVRLYMTFSLTNALPLNSMLAQLLEKVQSVAHRKSRSRSFLLSERMMEYLEKHATVPFRSKHVEEELHFHIDYLSRCLKKHTGLSPLQYQRGIQINLAKSLLETTELTITEISEQIGMGGPGYFNRVFRQTLGMTPSQYRKRFQANDAGKTIEPIRARKARR